MQIETYEVTEATTEGRDSFEIDAEALALIEELGLEGQQSLVVTDEGDTSVRTRIPYQKMTATEVAVYETLYPQKTAPESYSAGPIPLRVLQVIAHARTLFDGLRIWHPKEHDPDPVLVATLNRETFLLARWGESLAPFDDLRDRAADMLRRKFTAKVRSVMAECEAFLAAPDNAVESALAGESQWGKPWRD